MINIVLFEPEIPPNTGNIIRLCANTGYTLHLIEPLGFELSEKRVRRAGLDYRDLTRVQRWDSLDQYLEQAGQGIFVCLHHQSTAPLQRCKLQERRQFIVWPGNTRPADQVLAAVDTQHKLLIPMQSASRSLNLSNVVAIASYEAWRQNNFIIGQN